MCKGAIRNFPQETPYGPWPLLQPTQEDKQYQLILEPDMARARRLRRENRELFYLDLRDAVLKGIIIGLFFFGIIFGIGLNLPFWLQDWHWAFSIVGALVLGILVGLDLTLVVLATG